MPFPSPQAASAAEPMKEGGNITLLLLGDVGVGKSSLASTFVSRRFSAEVPGTLTRVRLPPDPALSRCTTTIIDTQEGDAALRNALSLTDVDRDSSEASRTPDADGASVVASEIFASKPLAPAEGRSKKERSSPLTSSSLEYESSAAKLGNPLEYKSKAVNLGNPFQSVDAIILVYDLDRIETFHRLEDDWLPLIEKCYHGDVPVVVAGNKVDVASASENTPTVPQIVSLLRRFKFIRQCIKCSAKKLLNVNEVFLKAQQSVLYPLGPLYDLDAGTLSPACRRAFTRIFRMFMDDDGLLGDAALSEFQEEVWGVPLSEKDFNRWKQMAARHEIGEGSGAEQGDVIRDGKFTLQGFLAIFDVLIASQNRPEVPWKVLRALNYDDELNLNVPASISSRGGDDLDSDDIDFLTSMFVQFDSDGDGTLSSTDIHSIFSVLPFPHPPWGERGTGLLFRDCFSLPSIVDEECPPSSPGNRLPSEPASISSPATSHPSSPSSRISASGITVSSSPLPSIDISKESGSICFAPPKNHKPLSFPSWMNHWHMICTISPSIARAEMYRLGRNFERKPPVILNRRVGRVAPYDPPTIGTHSTFVRALVLGSNDSGKSGLVKKLHVSQHSQGNNREIEYPATSCSVSKITLPFSSSVASRNGEETLVHVILTEVPALDIASDVDKRILRNELTILLGRDESGKRPYDMAVLVFDATNVQSLEFAKELESDVLTEEIPRVFVGTTSGSGSSSHEADEHCERMDLEPPLLVSLREEAKLDPSVIEHLVGCAQGNFGGPASFRSTPHRERKRRNAAKRRNILWIGGLVTAGITVVLGLSMTGKRRTVTEKGGWLRYFKNMLPFRLKVKYV